MKPESIEIILQLQLPPAINRLSMRGIPFFFPTVSSLDGSSTMTAASTTEIEIMEFLSYRLFHLANYVAKYPGKRIEISRVKKLRCSLENRAVPR